MSERRRLERFSLQTVATIEEEQHKGQGETYSMVTRDVSSGGAYVVTPEPLAEGKTVRVEMLLPVGALLGLLGETSKVVVTVRGKVVRTDERGMAIAFGGRHRISLVEKN